MAAKRPARGQRVQLLSTDLRDGAQTPGVNFSMADRIEIAGLLCEAGVDVIEAGFPASSKLNFDCVARIAAEFGQGPGAPVVCGFARSGRIQGDGKFEAPDIDAAIEALRPARRARVHIVGTGSDLHLREKYPNEGSGGRDRASNLEIVRRSVEHAVTAMRFGGKVADVEFSPEDCGRADRVYLVDLFDAAIRAGATVLNVPDTVGGMLPEDYGGLIGYLRARTPGAEHVIWSTHTHNDLGFATANTMAGIMAGARQVEGTFIGLGERAGNVCLEQVATILRLHAQHYCCAPSGLVLTCLPHLTRRMSELAGMTVPHAAPIVGMNAFRHKSGIHQDGILKNVLVYQDIPPDLVGREIELELGPDSGKAGLAYCVQRLGYALPVPQTAAFFRKFKMLADRVGHVSDVLLLELIVSAQLDRTGHVTKELLDS